VVVPGLQATPAQASDPLTFDHIAGLPRHQTPEDVAIDTDGNVYVAESGSYLNASIGDRVTKYDADGTFLDVLAGPGTGLGQVVNPTSVAIAPNGNIYVLENGDPGSGANEVSYFDPLGNQLGAWGAYGTGIGEFKSPAGIDVDSLGNVYVADNGNDRVQKFSSSGVGLASWTVNNVTDVTIDGSDTVWTAGGNTVARWTSGGTPVGSFAASGCVGVVVAADGTAWVSFSAQVRHYDASGTALGTISGLSTPEGLDITSNGRLYIADSVSASVSSGQIDVYTTASVETSWTVSNVTGAATDGSTVVAAGGGTVGMFSTSGTPGTSWSSNGAHSVAPDGAGNYWVSSSVDGVVRSYNASGSLGTTIGSGELSNPKGVAFAGGKVFVADPGNNKIFRFDQAGGASEASWTVTGVVGVAVSGATVYATDGSNVRTYTTAGAVGTSWGSAGARGIAIDGSGNVWVSSSAGLVREYTSGGSFQIAVGAGFLTDPVGVAVSGGKLYVADNGANKVKRFSTTNTYQLEWGQYPAPGVEDSPTGVAVDAGGYVYVTNKTQDLIQKYDATGAYVAQFGGSGSGNGLLSSPEAVAVASGGDIYVADTGNNRIERFTSAGAYVGWWGGLGTQPGTFDHPAGIAFDGSGNIYVSDTGNDRIQKFDSGMNYLTSWGGTGTGSGQFKSPRGLTVYGGSLWIADSVNNRISKFSTGGAFQAVLGSSGNTDGKLSAPYDVAVDGEGTVWVADRGNNRIQRLTTAGAYLSKLGSKGLDTGQFDTPQGIEVDAAGHVLVADTNNHRVQVFIDANGPDVTFLTGPGTATKLNTATFTFTANEPGSSFECKLDKKAFTACESPRRVKRLKLGKHRFKVRAIDAAGNVDPSAAKDKFKVVD
jgi:streptogramin lyase